MAEASISVDLLNPGQVFACLGCMEAAEVLCGPCQGRFDYTDYNTSASFTLRTEGPRDPVAETLKFLSRAKTKAVAPISSTLSTKSWNVEMIQRQDTIFPCLVPDVPAALPMLLTDGHYEIRIEHWADGSNRDNVKLWAGMAGKPGAAVALDILNAIAALDPRSLSTAVENPFSVPCQLSSGFRLDWRRDYTAIDAGFSPNDHQNSITMVGYPFVELLAVIGLQNARPSRLDPRNKLAYRYGVSSAMLPTLFARAVLGGESPVFPIRLFRMRLGWPGKEGQARCIIDAQEELVA